MKFCGGIGHGLPSKCLNFAGGRGSFVDFRSSFTFLYHWHLVAV